MISASSINFKNLQNQNDIIHNQFEMTPQIELKFTKEL